VISSSCTDAGVAGAIVMFVYMVTAMVIALALHRHVMPQFSQWLRRKFKKFFQKGGQQYGKP
jgi:hypothetical protein